MKYLLKSVAIFFVVALLSSCNTLKQPKEVYVPVDYTEQDAINAEIQRINELILILIIHFQKHLFPL